MFVHLHKLSAKPICTHLTAHVVNQSFHAGFHTKRMLARQQLWVTVPVEAHATREQLFEVLHDLCVSIVAGFG